MESTGYELSPAEKTRRESALEEARKQNALIAEAVRRQRETDLAKTAMAGADPEAAAVAAPVALGEEVTQVTEEVTQVTDVVAAQVTTVDAAETPAHVQVANMTANVGLDLPLRFAR